MDDWGIAFCMLWRFCIPLADKHSVLLWCPADSGLTGFTALVNLKVLKLKPPLNNVTSAPPASSYVRVKDLTQLRSLTVAVPVLGPLQMLSIGVLTGLQVSTGKVFQDVCRSAGKPPYWPSAYVVWAFFAFSRCVQGLNCAQHIIKATFGLVGIQGAWRSWLARRSHNTCMS